MAVQAMDPFLYITSAFKTGIWIFLLLQGIRCGLMRRYPLAYCFFTGMFIGFWVKTAAVLSLGPANPQYLWFYYGISIPLDFLALLILLRIYYLHHPPSLRKDWLMLAVPPLFIALSLTEPMHLFHRVSYVIFAFLATVGFMAASRNFFSRTWRIGDNLHWLTYGITIPAALQAFNQALNYLGGAVWSYDAFWVANELTTVISWGMIAHGMRRYDPPRMARDEPEMDPDEGARRLREYTKTLRRWL